MANIRRSVAYHGYDEVVEKTALAYELFVQGTPEGDDPFEYITVMMKGMARVMGVGIVEFIADVGAMLERMRSSGLTFTPGFVQLVDQARHMSWQQRKEPLRLLLEDLRN